MPVSIGPLTVSISFVVTSGTHCSILGMNAITTFDLTVCDGILVSRFGESPPASPPPTHAVARLIRSVTLGRREGTVAAMALCRPDGSRIHQECEAILDTGVAAVLIKTDRNGEFIGPCSNFSQSTMRIPTSANVGSITSVNDYSFLGQSEAAAIAMSQPVSPHTKAQIQEVHRLLAANIHRNTPRHHRARLLQLLYEYQDCFSCDKDDIGRCDILQHEIHLDTDKPIFIPQFRLSSQHFAAIKDQLAAWIKAGIVQRSRSPYNNPVFCVPKPHNRGFRVVSDFRTLNRHTLEDRYSIPSVDELLQRVGAAKPNIFSSIDLSSGFYHVPLRPSDEKFTAFTLPGMGQFVWKRAAMGLTGSPSSFCRILDLILHDVDNCLNYVDDILCFTTNFDSHLRTLRNVLERLRRAGLRANPEKSVFASYSVDYLGHNLTRQGIQPTMEKLDAIANMPEPQTPKQLDKVLGFFNYMSTFIYHYAAKCGPLFELRRQTSSWKGGPLPPQAAAAFQQLRRELSSRPVVAFATADGPLHLYVDCAMGGATDLGEGMGAALLQESTADGLQRPICYLSRQLEAHEKNYPAGLGEYKAIAWALDKLSPYLLHRKFFLYCDNKPLVDLNTFLKTTHKRTLKHCQHFLENFHPIWRHIPGSKNVLADFLSRYHGFQVHIRRQASNSARRREAAANVAAITHIAASSAVPDSSMPRIKLLQSMDPLCSKIYTKLRQTCAGSTMAAPIYATHTDIRWPITIINGIVLVKVPARRGHLARVRTPLDNNDDHPSNGLHFLTPVSMRHEVLNAAHECAGHFGSYKITHRILEDHWWPGLDKDAARHAAACAACLRATDKGTLPPAPLRPIPAATRPNDMISTDLFGPVVVGREDGQYVMTIVDAFTNHATIRVIPNKSAISVAQALLDYIYARGVPNKILTDCGKEFNNELQSHLWTALQVQKTWTSPYYPSVNGRAEKMNDILAAYLRKARAISESNKTDFVQYLGPLALHYNTTVCSTTRVSPHDALFGYNAKLPLWQSFEDIFPTLPGDRNAQDFLTEHLQRQLAARRIAYSNRLQQQDTMQRQHGSYDDVRFPMYQPRDAVLLRNMRRGTQPNTKLNEKWEPAYIISRVGPTTFRVCKATHLRKRGITNWAAANIKPDPSRDPLPHDKWLDLGGSTDNRASWDAYGYSQPELGRVAMPPNPSPARRQHGSSSSASSDDEARSDPDEGAYEHLVDRTPRSPANISAPTDMAGNARSASASPPAPLSQSQNGPPHPYNQQTPPYNPSHARPPTPTTPPAPADVTPPLEGNARRLLDDIDAGGLPNPPFSPIPPPPPHSPTPGPSGLPHTSSPIKGPSLASRRPRRRSQTSPDPPPATAPPATSAASSGDDSDMDTQHRYPTRSKRRHPSTTEEDLTKVVRSHRQRKDRRRPPKAARLQALQLAMHEQHSLQVAEAHARLRARQAESKLRQQLLLATSGWLEATPDMVLQALNNGSLLGDVVHLGNRTATAPIPPSDDKPAPASAPRPPPQPNAKQPTSVPMSYAQAAAKGLVPPTSLPTSSASTGAPPAPSQPSSTTPPAPPQPSTTPSASSAPPATTASHPHFPNSVVTAPRRRSPHSITPRGPSPLVAPPPGLGIQHLRFHRPPPRLAAPHPPLPPPYPPLPRRQVSRPIPPPRRSAPPAKRTSPFNPFPSAFF